MKRFFAPVTSKDKPFGIAIVIMLCVTPVILWFGNWFDVTYPRIYRISELTPYQGSSAEVIVLLIGIGFFLAARYFSPIRVFFVYVLSVQLLLLSVFGREICNVVFTNDDGKKIVATIAKKDKDKSGGGRKSPSVISYYLQIVPTDNSATLQFSVPYEYYEATAVGNTITLNVHRGFFGRDWISSYESGHR